MQDRNWGAYRGYGELELVKNRASMLLFGGTATDRRQWAEEAQHNFIAEGPLREVGAANQLAQALASGRGVVFIADACALGLDAQAQLMRCLTQREERPKIIVGLPTTPSVAIERGTLREDLLYKLQVAQVDLSVPDTRDAVKQRRQKEAERRAAENAALAASRPAEKAGGKQRPPVKVAVAAKTVVRVASRKAEKK